MLRCTPFLFVFLLFAANFSVGASSLFDFPLKAEDKPAFETRFSAFAQHPVIRGNFRQTKHIPKLNRDFISEGSFVIASGNGILWNSQKPFPSTLVIAKDKIVQKNSAGKSEVMKASENAAFKSFADMISSIFSGDPKKLYSRFSVFSKGSAGAWELGLVPIDASVRSVILSIELSGNANFPKTIRLKNADSSVTLYELSGESFADSLSAAEKDAFDGR